jgi:signal transduction histidine kinase
VADDGPGVPPELAEQVFEPGWRGDPADGHDGAGLGLALARRLATAARGSLTLTPGGPGATFVVRLPPG